MDRKTAARELLMIAKELTDLQKRSLKGMQALFEKVNAFTHDMGYPDFDSAFLAAQKQDPPFFKNMVEKHGLTKQDVRDWIAIEEMYG